MELNIYDVYIYIYTYIDIYEVKVKIVIRHHELLMFTKQCV